MFEMVQNEIKMSEVSATNNDNLSINLNIPRQFSAEAKFETKFNVRLRTNNLSQVRNSSKNRLFVFTGVLRIFSLRVFKPMCITGMDNKPGITLKVLAAQTPTDTCTQRWKSLEYF